MTTPRRRPGRATTATLLLLVLGAAGLAGCSSSGGDDSSGDAGGSAAPASAERGRDAAPAEGPGGAVADEDSMNYAAAAEDGAQSRPVDQQPTTAEPGDARSLIKKGGVSLEAQDVDRVRFDVTSLVEQNGGEVAEDQTEADDEGAAERTRLIVRVPEDAFQVVIDGLEQVEGAELVSVSTTTEDVTTQVIDTDVRVELQRRSIDRISLLLDQAESIRDVVSIERELARREADLGSLQKRQAFLADQTSMATISVAIQRPAEKKAPPPEKEESDEAGFLAGLEGGWNAFTAVTTGLLTGTGAVLPFALVALVVGVPAWVLVRRRRPAAGPATGEAQSA